MSGFGANGTKRANGRRDDRAFDGNEQNLFADIHAEAHKTPMKHEPFGPDVPGNEVTAETAFLKLPTLGPIAWLFGRTPDRRFLFLTDLDWAVMPPLVLDQCRLFMKGALPFAYFTWAFVNDDVHQRLLSGNGKLAPHEWKSGTHLWLIDVVTPFGGLQEMLGELQQTKFPGQALRYLHPDPATGKAVIREWAGSPAQAH